MVQVLPYVPTFGEKLADALGNATTTIGQGFQQQRQNQRDDMSLAIMNDPNKSPMEKVTAFMGLSEDKKKHVAPIYAAVLGPQAQAESQNSILDNFINREFGSQGAPQQPPSMQQPQPNQMGMDATRPAPQAQMGLSGQPVQQPQGETPQQAQPPQIPQENPKDLSTWSSDRIRKLAALGGSAGDYAKLELDRRKQSSQEFARERDFHTKGSQKSVEEANSLRSSVPKKEIALSFAKDAVQSGEVGSFSLNNLAERLNIPELRTAKGSQLLTAGKENLIGNLSAVSAKAQNQWIERRFADMFPQIGQSEAANETIATMLDSEIKMDRAYLDAFSELEKKDLEEHGYIKNDIARRAHEMAEGQQKEILNETSYKIREVYEKEKGIKFLKDHTNTKVTPGTPLTLQNAKVMSLKFENDFDKAIEHAKKMGYRIPSSEEADRWL